MADTRWRKTLSGIAVEEMLHLALVSNLMAAIGAAPVFGRPNFPQRSRYFPPGTLGFRHRALGGAAVDHGRGRPGGNPGQARGCATMNA